MLRANGVKAQFQNRTTSHRAAFRDSYDCRSSLKRETQHLDGYESQRGAVLDRRYLDHRTQQLRVERTADLPASPPFRLQTRFEERI